VKKNDELACRFVWKAFICCSRPVLSLVGFHSAPLTGSDIGAKPIVLLLGQYSTVRLHATLGIGSKPALPDSLTGTCFQGKTSFIRSVIGKQYPGEHIGVEPTTDRFVAVMHGNQDRILPGNATAVNSELPFRYSQEMLDGGCKSMC
jgi:EH domain-containing protein 3/EH domain-containing protein 1